MATVRAVPPNILAEPSARRAASSRVWRRFLRNRRAVVGAQLLIVVVGLILLTEVLAPYDPEFISPADRLVEPFSSAKSGSYHLFGTDQIGRDVLSRVLYGGRVSLGVSGAVVLISGTFGITLGLLAGYFGGWFDTVVMRLADMQLAIPTILFAIGIAAALGPSIRNLIIVLAVTNWVIFARIMRAMSLTLRESLYVEAARASGASHARIVFSHVLRNAWTPIIVIFSQQIALIIILESSLSFIGVGAPVGTPSWGTMVAEGRDYVVTNHWWLATFPGLAISITVLAINFFGDGLRDVLDPRLRL